MHFKSSLAHTETVACCSCEIYSLNTVYILFTFQENGLIKVLMLSCDRDFM